MLFVKYFHTSGITAKYEVTVLDGQALVCFHFPHVVEVESGMAATSGEKVPMNTNSRSPDLMSELLHRFSVKLLIDLSTQDGSWGAAALSRGVPYIGFCFGNAHVHCRAVSMMCFELQTYQFNTPYFGTQQFTMINCTHLLML